MSSDFNQFITNEQKQLILTQNMQELSAKAYMLSINKKVAEAVGNYSGVEEIEKDLQSITSALSVLEDEFLLLST